MKVLNNVELLNIVEWNKSTMERYSFTDNQLHFKISCVIVNEILNNLARYQYLVFLHHWKIHLRVFWNPCPYAETMHLFPLPSKATISETIKFYPKQTNPQRRKKVYKGTWGKWSVLPFFVDRYVMYSCLHATNFYWDNYSVWKKKSSLGAFSYCFNWHNVKAPHHLENNIGNYAMV